MGGQPFKQQFYSLLAPAVLIAIACLQLYLASAHHLTPWKGGGFGMFSTVDSYGARFLRCYLVTPAGEFPVEIPQSMSSLVRELRSIPTEKRMVRLAAQLVQTTWLHADYGLPGQALNRASSQSLPLTDENALTQDDKTPAQATSTVDNEQPADQAADAAMSSNQPQFRAQEFYEPDPPVAATVEVLQVRLELWRFHFDLATRQVKADQFRTITIDKPH